MKLKKRPLMMFRRIPIYILVTAILLWILGPFYVTIVSSFSREPDLLNVPPPWLLQSITFDNYQKIFSFLFKGGHPVTTADRVIPALRNSCIIALSVTAINLIAGGLAGYAATWLDFKFKKIFIGIIMLAVYTPAFPLMYPLFVTFQKMGLLDTHLAVIIAQNAFILPFSVWLFSGFFEAIPRDILDAASVDGCDHFQIFYKIVLPISLPAIFATSVFSFMLSWNDFLFPLLLTTSLNAMGVTPVIAGFLEDFRIQYALMNASALLAAIPPVVLVFASQKFLIKGLMKGAVKM